MSFKKILTISLLLSSAQANITSASIFKEMISTNPGVISDRPSRALSFLAKKDTITIEQKDLSAGAAGAGSSYKADVEITNLSGFYGGAGGGLTFEIFGESGSGGRTNNLKAPSNTSYATKNTTDSSLSLINIGVGIWKGLGIKLVKASAEDKSTYELETGSGKQSFSFTTKSDLTALTLGLSFSLGLDFALLYTKSTLKQKTGQVSADGAGNSDDDRFGGGVGFSTKLLRAEVGYFRNVKAQKNDGKSFTPSMIEGTVETAFGKLKLGYTGRYITDGYFMHRGILYNILAFQGNKEARLENTINFAYGSDSKGHSFSGSFSTGTVKSKATNAFVFNDTNAYDTETKTQTISLSYAYIF